ncbi:hypothetical protein E2I00_001175, partial [Balaenoptera physalus]
PLPSRPPSIPNPHLIKTPPYQINITARPQRQGKQPDGPVSNKSGHTAVTVPTHIYLPYQTPSLLRASCRAQGTSIGTQVPSPVVEKEDHVGGANTECQVSHGEHKEMWQCRGGAAQDLRGCQHTSFFLTKEQSHAQMNEFSWKDVASALSLANMILGLFSIFCSFCKKSPCASWMLLVSFLLDMAIGAMTRHLNICSTSGVILVFLSPLSLTAFYCLMWSLSYIFFPDALWGKAACLNLQHRRY